MKTGLIFTTLLLALPSAALLRGAGDEPRRPDLTGHVKGQTGVPITNASVFIYTVGPREGVGFL
jgi:hypothetical protein